jgi:formate/nitrite transporter
MDEICECITKIGVKKTKNKTIQTLLLAIFAGLFIGFGYHGYLMITQTFSKIDIGVSKFLGGSIFPIGLVLILIAGGELFTGNTLISMAYLRKKIDISKLLKNWTIVYFGNFIGCVILALLLFYSGFYHSEILINNVLNMVNYKVHLSFIEALLRGILCNIIVVLSICMAQKAKDLTSKILIIWFPIMVFVLSGFEHCIANMFIFTLGKLLGSSVTMAQMTLSNMIPVTIGNIIGGGIVIPLFYYFVHIKHKTNKE